MKTIIVVVGMALVLGISRFGFLDWGAPWYFHPDERNVAMAVSRIYHQIEAGEEDALNPDFFAYGGLPIYTIVGLITLGGYFFEVQDAFEAAIIASRILSAMWMVLVPLLTYQVGKYWGKSIAKTALAVSVVCVGYIQFARYGTFESWLTVCYLLFLWLVIRLWKHWSTRDWLLVSLVVGAGVAIKVPSLYLVPLLGLTWGKWLFLKIKKSHAWQTRLVMVVNMLISGLIAGGMAFGVFALSNPYAFREDLARIYSVNPGRFVIESGAETITWTGQVENWNVASLNKLFGESFIHSINVEGGIARGTIKTFYTRHFQGSENGIYQLTMIMPWLLSIPVMFLALWGLLGLGWWSGRRHWPSLILLVWIGLQLVFIFPLYVKWTRYMVPVLPGFILAASLGSYLIRRLIEILWKDKQARLVRRVMLGGLVAAWGWHALYTLMFGVTLTQGDTRMQAAEWTGQMMSKDIRVLSEVYDLGIVPFNSVISPSQITLFNFYDLDDNPRTAIDMEKELENYDVIILLSRRIWKHTTDSPEQFPKAAEFYNALFEGRSGFFKIQEFSNYPRFGPLIVYDEIMAEETFSVFDHPRVQIWVKQDSYESVML